jgi:hypothetical protein
MTDHSSTVHTLRKVRAARASPLVLLMVLLVLMMCSSSSARVADGAASHYTAMQQAHTRSFLRAFAQSMPALQSNWTGVDFCAWEGVMCTSTGASVWLDGSAVGASQTVDLPELAGDVDGSEVVVVIITLSNVTSLAGTLPASWSGLTQLAALHVTNSSLAGVLPTSWAVMSQLRSLMLSGNAIAGTLPEAWSALENLQYLDLESNKLRGTIPLSWGVWPAIRQVYLGGNAVTGPIPESWQTIWTAADQERPTLGLKAGAATYDAVATIPAGTNLVALFSALPPCSVPNCAVCITSSPFFCKLCDAGYSLTMGSWCSVDYTTSTSTTTSTTTTTTTTTSTTTSTSKPRPPCFIRFCDECVVSSPYYCKVCEAGFTLTMASYCQQDAQ